MGFRQLRLSPLMTLKNSSLKLLEGIFRSLIAQENNQR